MFINRTRHSNFRMVVLFIVFRFIIITVLTFCNLCFIVLNNFNHKRLCQNKYLKKNKRNVETIVSVILYLC